VAPLVNWANNRRNWLTRSAMEKMLGIDRRAALPSFHGRTFLMRSKRSVPPVDYSAPAAGREAVLCATCFINYNNPHIGEATRAVLSRNGVETEVLYPRCCGMPQLEQGDLAAVARSASEVAAVSRPPDRQRLRCRRASPVLRIDAQIRMATDRARQLRG